MAAAHFRPETNMPLARDEGEEAIGDRFLLASAGSDKRARDCGAGGAFFRNE
jgi:hypothetical protein